MSILSCALLLCCAASARTRAEAAPPRPWPIRPIKLIVPTGPGAATDVMARLLADGVVAHARPTDGGREHAGRVRASWRISRSRARQPTATRSFSPTRREWRSISMSFKQLPYDPTRDFTPVAMVCSLGPQMLSVNADAAGHDRSRSSIAYAKANRGKLSIAFDNTAGAAAFAAKLLNKRADLGLIEVPYRSAAQMTQDVASGVNQVMISSIAAANAVVQAGKVRRLAITSGKRFPGLPDLPSLSETVPGVVMNGFFAIVAPAGTPAEIVARLNARSASTSRVPRSRNAC